MKLDGLENIIGSLTDKKDVRVGIFGNKENRKEPGPKFNTKAHTRRMTKKTSGLTNADLGAIHEFGSKARGIPARSFLRMPIQHEANNIVKEISRDSVKLLAEGKINELLTRLGIIAENAVQLAFTTRGFNQWTADLMSTIGHKKSGMPLIDTGQLRRSITSKVVTQ